MTSELIVMPGLTRLEPQTLVPVADEFGWQGKTAPDLSSAVAQANNRTAAVLFHRSAVGPNCSWLGAVRTVKALLPGVALVACHGFSESFDWPELCDAGAFHALWLPLKENEIRKSFGFILQNQTRLASMVPAPAVPSQWPRAVHRMPSERSKLTQIRRAG